jgi:hypothetical protein
MPWIDDVLCSKLLREHQGSYLALAKLVRGQGAPRPRYFYVSVYRPLWFGWSADLDGPIHVHNTERIGIVGTYKPIPVDRLRKLDLYPFDQYTKARVAIDYAAKQGVPVELTNDNDDGTIVLFKNPRGKWQLSHFTMDVGPTGHIEGEDPVELLAEGLGGYCRWTPGRIDAIVSSLAE